LNFSILTPSGFSARGRSWTAPDVCGIYIHISGTKLGTFRLPIMLSSHAKLFGFPGKLEVIDPMLIAEVLSALIKSGWCMFLLFIFIVMTI
jgi:hypothetical protein